MKIHYVTVLWICTVACAEICRENDRSCVVTMSFETSNGDPLRGIGVSIRGCEESQMQWFQGVSNDAGVCVVDCIFDDSAIEIFVNTVVPPANGYKEDEYAVFLEARASAETWAFEAGRRIAIPEQGDVSVTVTLPPAITLNGRLVNSEGEGIWGIVGRVNGMLARQSDDTGNFVLPGVRMGESVWLWAANEEPVTLTLWHVDGALLGQDTDLGDIVFDSWAGDTQLSIEVLGWKSCGMAMAGDASGPLIVRDDLSVAIAVQILASGDVLFGYNGDETTIDLPAGKYYIIPASSFWADEVSWLLDAIEEDDPALAQVPSVELIAGQSQHIQVDYPSALATIRSVFGPP